MFTNRHLLKATEIGFGISFDDSFLSLDDTSLRLGPIFFNEFDSLTPYLSALDFWKIELSISNFNFAGSKNQVHSTVFLKNQVQIDMGSIDSD